ncbi:MAG: asparagine synthase (glutamine-hydrolyzing) [Clostridia bacterium]|nr:asparagine synthase (glutamine-hydrolyzing) [Clostridia bacterium]
MCGIAGFVNFQKNLFDENALNIHIAKNMAERLRHRGPDSWGEWLGEHVAFSHSRLAVIDVEHGKQPMKRICGGYEFVITYNGELYNTAALKAELSQFGYEFSTECDTEVLLYTYIHYGDACVDKLNGIYAFCIWDSMRQRVFACRDRFGVKPFFYTFCDDAFIFASELKALFKYPGVEAEVDKEGLQEIFAIGPARTQGKGIFKGIFELRPGHCMIICRSGTKIKRYWQFKSMPHTDSYEETIEKVRFLLTDAITRQLVSDVPICTFLSGGLDSSIITAVAANTKAQKGEALNTFSFDYSDNEKYFKTSAFQPDSDRPWVDRMSSAFHTNHTHLVCNNNYLADALEDALIAKDLPGMADIDSSLLYFCSQVKKTHTVALSGECSDEIFGGYPWFRSEKPFGSFPWSHDMTIRNSVLRDSVANELNLEEYSLMRYRESVAETPRLESDTPENARRREIFYLNINWFMLNLLERKDRMSMASGLEVRVPFCDHLLAEYVWNIPWEMKNKDNISKNILREAAKTILPTDVLMRKKSPYPKTHHPLYEKAVKNYMTDVLANPNSPILEFVDKNKVLKLCSQNSDYGKPFFGQLMAGPQFLAYLLQVNYWLRDYCVKIL